MFRDEHDRDGFMNRDRWHEIDRVLDLALDRDPIEWPRLLDDECSGDPQLRAEVQELLAGADRVPPILDARAGAVAAALLRDRGERVDRSNDGLTDALDGVQLGAWRIVGEVGRGGMSRVYEARRVDGKFDQRVAIKVLRAGLDTPADVQRFHSERRILAALDHPAIARLLDGGVTPDGRPYLVLEYVDGVPLDAWCTQHKLDTEARLRLMQDVAEATQSAHRRLVVHRDLKPSNILVDAHGRPRLLDFGIAKMLDPDTATPATETQTGTRQRWLSPAYAAPEQFTGAPVTTATDVYQLGAVLYELLTGRVPYPDHTTGDNAARRDEPAPPSTVKANVGRDLDAIILKAMRHEPEARYATAADFAADLQRVIDGDPVQARVGERAYRWRRRLRRRAVPLTVGTLGVLAIMLYAATLIVQNRRIALALADATAERRRAEQVTSFMRGLFEADDPRGGRRDSVTARDLLRRGEDYVDGLGRQPQLQAELLDVIGQTRVNLGAFEDGRRALDRALAIRRQLWGDSHPDVARSIAALARLDGLESHYQRADSGYRQALATFRSTLTDSAAVTQQTLFQLAGIVHSSGAYSKADSIFAEWERLASSSNRPRDAEYATQLHDLGDYVYARALDAPTLMPRAARYFSEALTLRRVLLDSTDVALLMSMDRMGRILWRQGKVAESDTLYMRALRSMRANYPAGHGNLADLLFAYGSQLLRQGRAREAVPVLHEASTVTEKVRGPHHVLSAVALSAYGDALRSAGQFVDAERALRLAETRLVANGGVGAVMADRTRVLRAGALVELGQLTTADSVLRLSLQRLQQRGRERGALAQETLRWLIVVATRQSRLDEAARFRSQLITGDSATPVPISRN